MKKIIYLLFFAGLVFAKTEVTKITFKHTTSFNKDDLLEIIHSEEDEDFDPRLLKLDLILLNNFFQKSGYLLINVSDSLFFNDQRTKVRIKYIIDNGPLYYYGGVRFNGVVDGDIEKLMETFSTIEIGTSFDESKIIEASRLVENLYYNSGKPFVSVNTDYLFEQDSLVFALLNIKENNTIYIKNIKYSGLELVQRFLIRRELEIKIGDMYSRESLERSQQNIYSTGLFRFARMEIDPIPDEPNNVVLKIIVQEKDAKWIGFNVGVGNEQGFGNTAEFTVQGGHRNIFGTARSASIHFTPSFLYEFDKKQIENVENKITFKFVEPWIGNTRTPGIFQLSYNQFRYSSSGKFNLIQSSFELHHKFEHDIELNGTLSAKFVNRLDDNTIDSTKVAGIDVGKSQIYSISVYGKKDTRQNLFNPLQGSLLDLSLAFSQSIGSDSTKGTEVNRFFTLITSWSNFQPLVHKFGKRKFRWTLASRLKSGTIFELDDSKSIPISELFYAGGATTVRGYPEQLLGPVAFNSDSSKITAALGGKILLLANIEARIPIWWLFVGEVFIDAGNVWRNRDDLEFKDIRYTTGIGLAIITPLGPVRIDYGYKLNKRKFDPDPDAWHLGIYFAF